MTRLLKVYCNFETTLLPCRAALTHVATLAAAAAAAAAKLSARCNAWSACKELVSKVHAGLKAAIKEAQTDTAHGMPLFSEILTSDRGMGMP